MAVPAVEGYQPREEAALKARLAAIRGRLTREPYVIQVRRRTVTAKIKKSRAAAEAYFVRRDSALRSRLQVGRMSVVQVCVSMNLTGAYDPLIREAQPRAFCTYPAGLYKSDAIVRLPHEQRWALETGLGTLPGRKKQAETAWKPSRRPRSRDS